jgi:hypothetical protein
MFLVQAHDLALKRARFLISDQRNAREEELLTAAIAIARVWHRQLLREEPVRGRAPDQQW